MFTFIGQTICAFLISISVLFIVIEMSAKFDRRFLVFGTTNLLLCLFCAIDFWFQFDGQTLYWTKAQHIIASFFPAMLIWHVMLLVRKVNMQLVRLLLFLGMIFTGLFLSTVMLQPHQNEIISTTLYNMTFAPYILVAIIGCVGYMIYNIRNLPVSEKRIAWLHLVGFLLVCCGGTLDLIAILLGKRLFANIPSHSVPGIMGFVFVTSLAFVGRLNSLLRERDETFGKLREAYKELEDVQALKEIGQSTTIINHEIRNYMTTIKGFADVLYNIPDLESEKRKKYAKVIFESATKLTVFSNDILEFSKSKIVKDKRPINISQLVRKNIEIHFKSRETSIIVDDKENLDVIMNGDWARLEHVFINIFKNAFEADAKNITLRLSKKNSLLMCTIDDDGVGCTEEQFGNLFKSFYTTKKNSGGTGLGMCLMRSIVESHGGTISAYSKNLLNERDHGLILIMCFPLYEEELSRSSDHKDPLLLIKDGIIDLSVIFQIFRNVLISPHIVQTINEIDPKIFINGSIPILATPNNLLQLRKKLGTTLIKPFALVPGSKNTIFIIEDKANTTPQLLSEEYLIKMYCFNKPAMRLIQ
jgi:signal transduction histidine kinase